jgi:hypothetical protein
MGASVISGEAEVRKVLETACGARELMILTTPYMRFESNFLALDAEAVQARITMSAEEAMYGLRSPELRFRFPHVTRFLEGRTRLLGFGLLDGRRTLRLAVPKSLQDDELRRAYRVERAGRTPVTFSTPKFEIKSAGLVNLSTSGARLQSFQEPLETLLKGGDTIAVSIQLTEEIHIDTRAVVRWVQGRVMGVEFQPVLESRVMAALSRWVFQRREEDKDRVVAIPSFGPVGGKSQPSLVLVSGSQEVEDGLRELLTGLPPIKRIAASVPALKEAASAGPPLVLFHLADAGLDSRRRLKMLVETLAGKVPFILLGTQVENSVLFDLGSEHKAAAVYDFGARPGTFFLRLVQGILRRQGEASKGVDPA